MMRDEPIHPISKIEVKELRMTCPACPSQWEGVTVDGLPVYVRYRWGYLSVRVGGTDGVDGEEVFGKRLGDNLDGSLGFGSLITATAGKIDWPCR